MSGEKTQFMASLSKEFSEDWQRTGDGISLFSIAQVIYFLAAMRLQHMLDIPL